MRKEKVFFRAATQVWRRWLRCFCAAAQQFLLRRWAADRLARIGKLSVVGVGGL